MIEIYKGTKKEKEWIFNYLNQSIDVDFYLTDNNQRIFTFTKQLFSKLLKNSTAIYYLNNNIGDMCGVGIIWRAQGGEVNRYYVKLKTDTSKVAVDILTTLIWNSPVKTLHAKLSRESKYFKVLAGKGFKWLHGRGKEALLSRVELRDKSIIFKKDED